MVSGKWLALVLVALLLDRQVHQMFPLEQRTGGLPRTKKSLGDGDAGPDLGRCHHETRTVVPPGKQTQSICSHMYFTRTQSQDRENRCTSYQLDDGLVWPWPTRETFQTRQCARRAQQLGRLLQHTSQPNMGEA